MTVEQLGIVNVPSGIVLVIDTGLLNLWSHDDVPMMPEGILSPEATISANAAEDFHIEGPDAEAAGKAFGRQWNPRFLYDIPGARSAEMKEEFSRFAAEAGVDAHLVAQATRIPHRRRVAQTLQENGLGGVVQFSGIPAIAAGGLPRDRGLRVLGERMNEGDFPDCWRWVALELKQEADVHRSVALGRVGVDWARLMFIDADALGAWRDDESIDGLADVVFWGRDAEQVAATARAERLDDSTFGWRDLELGVALERGINIEDLQESSGLKFASDFRPHTDHFRLLEQMRASATGSGTLDVGNSRCCGFFTSWGDGLFPLHADFDAAGELVQVRAELATDQTIANMRAVNGLGPEQV